MRALNTGASSGMVRASGRGVAVVVWRSITGSSERAQLWRRASGGEGEKRSGRAGTSEHGVSDNARACDSDSDGEGDGDGSSKHRQWALGGGRRALRQLRLAICGSLGLDESARCG